MQPMPHLSSRTGTSLRHIDGAEVMLGYPFWIIEWARLRMSFRGVAICGQRLLNDHC